LPHFKFAIPRKDDFSGDYFIELGGVAMKPVIRLSQCMIVKDEEKNIQSALNWGKGIVCEQIVVDTGSVDKTVEIAEAMGAKVFHLPWNHDFSSAKNFAIEQAKGNWIAFLDADEYFSEEGAKKILPLLKQLEKSASHPCHPHVIRTMLVNLDDSGNHMNTGVQYRIFRNIPKLRYRNRIHEYLDLSDGRRLFSYDAAETLAIFHTGYASSVFTGKNKEERNIYMIKKELEENPENYMMWSYLGDSLLSDKQFEEAEEAYRRATENPSAVVEIDRKNLSFAYWLKTKYIRNFDNEEEFMAVYQKAKDCGCNTPDVDYWAGRWFGRQGDDRKTKLHFEQALRLLEEYKGNDPLDISGQLSFIYNWLFFSCVKENLASEIIRYGVLALRVEPYQPSILKEILLLLKGEPGEEKTATATFGFLSKLYDLSSFKNKAFLIKISERVPFPALEEKIYHLLSDEEREFVAEAGDIF